MLKPLVIGTVALLGAIGASLVAHGEPPAMQVERALLAMLENPEPDLEAFAREWAAASTLNAHGLAGVMAELASVHETLHGAEQMDVMLDGQGVLTMEFAAPGSPLMLLRCRMQTEPPHRIVDLSIEREEAAPTDAVTWATLGARLDAEAAQGFTGVVLVVRDGETVVERGFGLANRSAQFPVTPGTIFAIGSAPIDFTFVGIMQLQEEGKLAYSDPITKYFDNVPADKRSITLEHLMTGRSGLRNFHDIPSDRDPDHHWISRDEAMQRIFDGELLFKPGTSREHSHSAWGVLAAVIEIVSEQTYQEFTRERIYKPLRMHSTGFHGDTIVPERLAIGYGMRTDGELNAPPYWGETSWLVMGSGGQVSTAGDMGRFIEAVASGEVVNEENTALFRRASRGLLNGGNAYGFEIYYTYAPDTYMVLLANAVDANTRRPVAQLARDIGDLILESQHPPYSMGVGIGMEGGRLFLSSVAEGSAAWDAGLREGDVLVGIGGQAFGEDVLELLDPYLHSGKVIPLDVEQDGQRVRVMLKPRRRGG